jgi:hypothetical protein
MPRKKTIQPGPDETFHFTLEDELYTAEVRGKGSWVIGRGQHRKNEYEVRRDKVVEWVADQYLTL